MSKLLSALATILLLGALLSCQPTAPEPTTTAAPSVTPEPAVMPTPVPSVTPRPSTPVFSAAEVLARTNEKMASTPGFRLRTVMQLKLKKEDISSVFASVVESEGKPGGDESRNSTSSFWINNRETSMKVEERTIGTKTYYRFPDLPMPWQIRYGTPYSQDNPVSSLCSGKLSLSNMSMTTESSNANTVYRLSGVPVNNSDVELVTLWIADGSFLVTQMEVNTSAVSYGMSYLGLSPGAKVFSFEKYQFQPLSYAVKLTVPEELLSSPSTYPPAETVSTPFGTMVLYQGKRIPCTLQYPAAWVPSFPSEPEPSYPMMKRHASDTYGQLTITEPSFKDLKLSNMSLEAYAETVISSQKSFIPDYKLINQEILSVPGGEKAKVVIFSSDGGKIMYYRLIYVHENNLVFNMTYSYHPAQEDLKPLINYSFGTFKIKKTN